MRKKIRCECPTRAESNPMAEMFGYSPEEEIAKVHEPNKCKGTYGLQEYIRGGKKIWLCSCCNVWGDVPTGRQANDLSDKGGGR